MESESSKTKNGWSLPRIWASFLLLLIAVTWRLWVPQDVVPPVPLLDLPIRIPAGVGWLPFAGLIAALVGLVAAPNRLVALWWVVAACLGVAFLLDQHRLQPWAYQSTIYAIVFASVPASDARRWIMPLAISVYIYSGLGKLDYQFAHSLGQDLINVAAAPLGGLPDGLSEAMRARLALTLPAIECLTGVCLIFRRFRRVAGVTLIVMHVTLIVTLGPWGLNHSLGVLCWNLALIVQAWILFVRPRSDPREETRQKYRAMSAATRRDRWSLTGIVARVCVIFALVAPLSERSGYWDHWLSWALYAPHNSRVDVEVHRSSLASFDERMLSFVDADDDGDGWRRLSLSRWSLETLAVPIYPQARYQLGLACEVAKRHALKDGIRAKIRGPADRFTGERREQFVIGQRELEDARGQYWLGG